MKPIFADTFYWIAITNPQDRFHENAKSLTRTLPRISIVTTQEVLIEYMSFFGGWGSHFRGKALINVRSILANPGVTVLQQSSASFELGLRLYGARPDKGYSMTDCISMGSMRRLAIEEVLTNDGHFEQEGFRPLFRKPQP